MSYIEHAGNCPVKREPIALLTLPGSVYSELRRGGESFQQSHTSGNPHNSRVIQGGGQEAGNSQSNSAPICAPFLSLVTKEILLWF